MQIESKNHTNKYEDKNLSLEISFKRREKAGFRHITSTPSCHIWHGSDHVVGWIDTHVITKIRFGFKRANALHIISISFDRMTSCFFYKEDEKQEERVGFPDTSLFIL